MIARIGRHATLVYLAAPAGVAVLAVLVMLAFHMGSRAGARAGVVEGYASGIRDAFVNDARPPELRCEDGDNITVCIIGWRLNGSPMFGSSWAWVEADDKRAIDVEIGRLERVLRTRNPRPPLTASRP
jgi:hypothetical protein